ncbi:hypothetical protein MNEG_13651, partial [Monoraphidium neglectum]
PQLRPPPPCAHPPAAGDAPEQPGRAHGLRLRARGRHHRAARAGRQRSGGHGGQGRSQGL